MNKRNFLSIFAALSAGLLMSCSSVVATDSTAAAAPEKILVFGASGRTGRQILAQLEANDRNFVGVTSNIERARENVGADIAWVQADVRDPASVQAAMAGVTHVISALGATKFEGDNGPEFVDWQGVRNVVDASLAEGVSQMVLVSSAGVTDPDHILNKLGNVMVWKLKAEDYLRASGLPYTIVRPGGLLDKNPGENQLLFRQGDSLPYTSKLSVTTRYDVASICIAALDNDEARNKTFEAFVDRSKPATEPDWPAMFGALATD